MSVLEQVVGSLMRVIRMNDRLAALTERVDRQQQRIEDVTERVIRLETALELVLAQSAARTLPARKQARPRLPKPNR